MTANTSPSPDWYARRDELTEGMILRNAQGEIVKLDRTVPGDSTRWYVADWINHWSYMDSTVEASDLIGEPIDEADVPRLAQEPFALPRTEG